MMIMIYYFHSSESAINPFKVIWRKFHVLNTSQCFQVVNNISSLKSLQKVMCQAVMITDIMDLQIECYVLGNDDDWYIGSIDNTVHTAIVLIMVISQPKILLAFGLLLHKKGRLKKDHH